MQAQSSKTNSFLRAALFLGLLAALAIFIPPHLARAATITVCASGCDYTTIQDAVTAASLGDTINVSAGTYPVPSEIALNKANLTLQGAGSGSTIVQVSGTGPRFNISASGVTIDGFGIQKTDKTGTQDIIYIGANNATITNNEISGQYVFGDGDVSRAMIFTGGLSGLTISNNTIHDIRQPGYISGVTTGTISNNYVYRTRGWVVEEGNMTFTGNTWGTGANSNIYDIAILSAVNGIYYTDIPAMAAANNNAFIEDQRTVPPTLSIVYVDGSVAASGDGTARSPKKTIGEGVTRVVIGGTIHVLAGTYAENVTVNKQLTLDGAGSGSNPVTDTIISGSGSGSGTGLLLSAGTNAALRVVIKDVRVTNFDTGVVANSYNTLDNVASVSNITYGINLSPLQDLVITNSKFNSNEAGLKIASTASVDNVTISGSEFNSNTKHGWYSDKSSGSSSNVTNLNISYTTFNDNVNKGFYTEKLSNAVFDHITVNNSGTGGPTNHRAGMDINLKYGNYSNIQITNSTISNNGTGDDNGGGILIKARSTGSYAGNPATLDDVTLSGLTVTGNGGGTYAAGIRIGESNNSFTGIDPGPTNVVISNSAFSGNSAHGVRNATLATTVLAESNWWGNSSGPNAPTNPSGTGDAVSIRVDYSPWWDANYVGDPHASPWTWHTNDSIQHAIDLASASDTIRASAGTYIEELDINKPLTLLGPNDSINPNVGPRVAEAILQPATSDPDPNGNCTTMAYLEASNVTIKGFTFDGDNPALTSGITIGGADVDACQILAEDKGIGNITVENNILKYATYAGIDFYNYTSDAATSNNYIRYNLLSDIGETTYNWGIGVLLYNNFYADVTDNVFNNVRTGIQTGNFYRANVGSTGSISNNTINAWRSGIFHNLWYSNASTIPVANNTINAISSAGSTKWNGMLISSWQNAVDTTITNNTINIGAITQNPAAGYNIWNTPTSAHITISGGTVTGGNYGVWVNNFEGYSSNAGGNTSIYVDGVTISDAATAGVYVLDSPSNTNGATVFASVQNNTISNTPTGILVEGADGNASLTTSNVTATATDKALHVKSGGSVTANNALDLNGNATIESGGTLAAGTTSEIRVAGNWSNNGAFTPGTGKVKFDGAVAQSIGGTVNPAPFNDLDLSNTHASGITSNVNATVDGQLAMNQDSNLDMGGNTLTMGVSSNPATAGTGQGDVVGKVTRTSFVSGTSYNFGSPFLAFNNLTFTTAPTAIDVTLATSAPGSFGTAILRTYTLGVNGGSGVATDLRLHYRDDALNSNTEAALRQFRYNGSTWDYIGDSSRSVTDNWVQKNGVNSFSDWTLADKTPTAVLLAGFQGKQKGAQVQLTWDTASEVNLVGFNVWRARGKGEFVKLNAELIPALSPGVFAANSYAYADPLSKKGAYHYKLELVTTADTQFSEQINVRFKPAATGCATVTAKAQQLSPQNKAVVKGKSVQFDWSDIACAARYEFTLRAGSADGAVVASETNLAASAFTVAKLKPGVYFWSVRGCNATSCGPSRTVEFTLERNKK